MSRLDLEEVPNHTSVVRDLLTAIGEDPTRDGLKDTPARVAKSWEELYAGYRQDPGKILSKVFEHDSDEIVLVRGIKFFSSCEHHLLPFVGTAHVAYLPHKGKGVVGLSKIARLVDCFARRLQLQERLTMQIGQAIEKHLSPKGVGVVVNASHYCMLARGVRSQEAEMVTSYMGGCFREDAKSRAELLAMVGL